MRYNKLGIQNKKWLWWISIDLLILSLLLTVAMTSGTATIFCVCLLGATFFIKSSTFVTVDLLFFYPFYNLFKINGVGSSFYNYLIGVAIIALVLKLNKSDKFYKYSFSLLLLSVYAIFINYANSSDLGIVEVILDLFVPILLFIVVSQFKYQINETLVFYMYGIGVIIAGICGTMLLPIPNLESYIMPLGWKVGGIRLIRLQGLTVNPNYFSLDVNLAIAAILSLSNTANLSRIGKQIKISVIFGLCAIGVMTLSKSFLVVSFLTFLYFAWANRTKNLYSFVLFFIVIVFVYTNISNIQYADALLSRMSDDSDTTDALTSSRSYIWLSYINSLFSNPDFIIWGSGANSNGVIVDGAPRGPHNTYLEAIYHFGIIGSLWLFWIISSLMKSPKQTRIHYLPLFVVLVRMFAIHILLREAFLTCLIVILLSIKDCNDFNYNDKKKKRLAIVGKNQGSKSAFMQSYNIV